MNGSAQLYFRSAELSILYWSTNSNWFDDARDIFVPF